MRSLRLEVERYPYTRSRKTSSFFSYIIVLTIVLIVVLIVVLTIVLNITTLVNQESVQSSQSSRGYDTASFSRAFATSIPFFRFARVNARCSFLRIAKKKKRKKKKEMKECGVRQCLRMWLRPGKETARRR